MTRVSVSSGGVEGNSASYNPSLSADGRYVVFESSASNLVANDTNQTPDIFLHDMQTGITSRVSLGPNNEQGQSISIRPVISANGRYVAFYGASLNWLNTDSGYGQLWVRDLQTNTTTLVSVGIGAQAGDGGDSFGPSLSDDGRYIAFYSNATNLIANDKNGLSDVFVRDMQTATTSLVSITTSGLQGNGSSFTPAISGDGSIIAFVSTSTNLVSGDTNNVQDVFVRNRLTNTIKRITVNTNGVQGNGASREPAVNQDGSLILFRSYATNLDLSIVDSNNVSDVFLYRPATTAINLISKNSNGVPGNAASSLPALDADGHRAVYLSTATNLDLSLNDSEVFADVFTVAIPNQRPIIGAFDTAVTYKENAAPVLLDNNATVTDSDSPDFAGGQLTIKLTARAQSTDVLGIRTGGSGTSAVSVDEFGVNVGGFLIASFTGGTGITPLVFSFNSSATRGRVQTLLRAITFSNASENPSANARTVQVTLTDGDGGTSTAVSKTVNVTPVNDKPVIGAFDTAVTYKKNAAPVLLDNNATVSDVDSSDFNTGKMTVSITANKQPSDVLGIRNIGTGFNQINVSGNQVFLGNILLGTFTGGTNNAALVITLNANATPGRTQFLLRAITFGNSSPNPSVNPRTVQVTLSDGDGGTSLAGSKTVNIV